MDDRVGAGTLVLTDEVKSALERQLRAPHLEGWTEGQLLDHAVRLRTGDLLSWGRENAELVVEFESSRLARPRPDTALRVEGGEVREFALNVEDRAPTLLALPNIRLPIGAGQILSPDGQVLRVKTDDPGDLKRVPSFIHQESETTAICAPLPPVMRILPEAIYLHTGSKYFAMRMFALAGIAAAREVIKTSRIPFVVEAKAAPAPIELEMIRRFGFEDNEIISAQRGDTLVERLWFPFVPIIQRETFTTSAVALDLFRKHTGIVEPARGSRKDRIYISREDAPWRHVANEAEVQQTLSRYGFRVVRFGGKSGPECVEEFKNAEIVVGLTGSSLANSLFAPPGTWLIEISPRGYGHIGFDTYAASTFASFRHPSIQTAGDYIPDSRKLTHWDVQVACDELTVAVEYALGRSGET
jgi:hypothetical protein